MKGCTMFMDQKTHYCEDDYCLHIDIDLIYSQAEIPAGFLYVLKLTD